MFYFDYPRSKLMNAFAKSEYRRLDTGMLMSDISISQNRISIDSMCLRRAIGELKATKRHPTTPISLRADVT